MKRHRVMNEWYDDSSYRRGSDADPISFRFLTKSLEISVHRHIDHTPDTWLVSCRQIEMSRVVLDNTDAHLARGEATDKVTDRLELMLLELAETRRRA